MSATELNCLEVLHETDLAILCLIQVEEDEEPEEFWVPKSVIHDDSEVYSKQSGDSSRLLVATWWARKNGL